jgi:hypothetical protein
LGAPAGLISADLLVSKQDLALNEASHGGGHRIDRNAEISGKCRDAGRGTQVMDIDQNLVGHRTEFDEALSDAGPHQLPP